MTALKIDPYLNVDAGTMSPIEHGEVFVLDDGGECDLDLGNYERFLSVFLTIFTHGMPCFWLCSHLYFRLDSGGIAVVLMWC